MKNIKTVASLALGFVAAVSSAVAFATPYFPPERIQCAKDITDVVRCQGLNGQYLVVGDSNKISNKKVTLSFQSGQAIFGGKVVFTYQTGDRSKSVDLVSASSNIQPDLSQEASWVDVGQGKFACDSYMTCPLTNTSQNETSK